VAQRSEDIKSISTMDNIVGTEEGIDAVPLMEEVPTTREEIERLKENLYGNDMFVGWLVSEDGTAAMIMAMVEDGQEKQNYAYEEVKKIVAREQGGGDRIYIAGQPVLEATFIDYIVSDMKKMLPFISGIVALLLYLLFGSVRGMVLPLSVVVAAAMWCMGLMGLLGVPAYDLTTLIPVILIAMGSADGIHILTRYYEEAAKNSSRDRRAIVLETMLTIWPPIMMTSLTTAIGFGSLLTSRLVPIRSFGVFTGVGIICAFLFSLTFIPAGLMLVKLPETANAQRRGLLGAIRGDIDLALGFAGRMVYRYRMGICIFSALLAVVAGIGFVRVRANDSWVEMFPHESDIYIASKLICEKLNGTVSMNVVIEGEEADIIKSPSILRKLVGLQEVLEEMEPVGGTISIADYIRRMNKVMNADREEFDTIPDSREAVAQYLLLYSLSGDPDDFDEVVDYDYQKANMTAILKDDHTDVVKSVAERIGEYVDEHFSDEPVEVNLTGYAYVTQVVIDLAVKGMLTSIIISIVVIYAMTALMFRSLSGGIYNIIPITMAMLINFGLMGMLGVTIGFANSVTFAVALGIGVDYAIHLVFKFQREVAGNDDLEKVTADTLTTSGKAILFNAVVVTAGFLVLLTASFTGHRIMGRLISLSMATSFLGSMTLLPAALSVFRPAFVFRRREEPEEAPPGDHKDSSS
jgi:hydrophobe/amphiphile efflux-3 (HAE3) family protein